MLFRSGCTPDFLDELESCFVDFLRDEMPSNPEKSEYLLPVIVGKLVEEGKATVAVLPTDAKWFGVTYKEDKPLFVECLNKLIAEGKYPEATFQ